MVLPIVAAGARAVAGTAAKNAVRAGAKGAATDAAAGTTGSGIRNATVRYTERVEDLSTVSHIYNRGGGKDRANQPRERSRDTQRHIGTRASQRNSAGQELEARRLFNEAGIDYEPEEISEIIKGERPEEPDFPFFIFYVAIIKDVLDALDLTGVGAVVTTIFSIIVGGILLIWMFRHLSGPRWKKKHAERMAKRLLAVIGIELVPFLKIIPTNTIWVLMNHYSETKLAQSLNNALSRLPAQLRDRIVNRVQ